MGLRRFYKRMTRAQGRGAGDQIEAELRSVSESGHGRITGRMEEAGETGRDCNGHGNDGGE